MFYQKMKWSFHTEIPSVKKCLILFYLRNLSLRRRRVKKLERECKTTLTLEKITSLLLFCGSVFKNPNGDSAGRLLELAGAKELQIGGARVWENHANFIVNDRACTSEDVLNLMFDMYSMVKNKFGIELEPEVRFLGGNNENEVKLCKILYRN